MENYLTKAIKSLKPNAEFTFSNNDYSTIKWHVIEGKAPTKAEIEAEIEKIKIAENNEVDAKASAKAALLERLGITADEANLLLS
jgi:hypothetical protein